MINDICIVVVLVGDFCAAGRDCNSPAVSIPASSQARAGTVFSDSPAARPNGVYVSYGSSLPVVAYLSSAFSVIVAFSTVKGSVRLPL